MKHYEVILFDVDGTLLDFDKAEERGIEALLAHYGVPVCEENIEKYHNLNQSYWQRLERGELTRDQVLSLRFEEYFGDFGIEVDGAAVDLLYRKELESRVLLIDGALDILDWLRKKYGLFIITNGVASTQHKRLGDADLARYFKDIFISEELGVQKPRKEFFDRCFERMGRSDVEHMLVVGDSLTSDIRGGNGSGIDTCWFNPHGKENTAGEKVDYEIRRLGELRELL